MGDALKTSHHLERDMFHVYGDRITGFETVSTTSTFLLISISLKTVTIIGHFGHDGRKTRHAAQFPSTDAHFV